MEANVQDHHRCPHQYFEKWRTNRGFSLNTYNNVLLTKIQHDKVIREKRKVTNHFVNYLVFDLGSPTQFEISLYLYYLYYTSIYLFYSKQVQG